MYPTISQEFQRFKSFRGRPVGKVPFPPFPGGFRRFCKKCYFCYFFITDLLPFGTPSKTRVLHIIHRVFHIVMSTVESGKKCPLFQGPFRRKFCPNFPF